MKSYLLYAFGEIILIILGILGAIQVDNWNENRKHKVEEKLVLTNLSDNLKNAKKQSTEYITTDVNQFGLIEGLLNINKKDSIIRHPNVDFLIYKAIYSVENNVPLIQTYTDLKISGRIMLVSKIELRDKLAALESSINSLKTLQTDRFTVQQLRVDQIAEKEVNFVLLLKSLKTFKIDNEGSSNDYKKLLSNRTIRNLFGLKLVLTKDVLDARKDLDRQIDELIKLIDTEMKNAK